MTSYKNNYTKLVYRNRSRLAFNGLTLIAVSQGRYRSHALSIAERNSLRVVQVKPRRKKMSQTKARLNQGMNGLIII